MQRLDDTERLPRLAAVDAAWPKPNGRGQPTPLPAPRSPLATRRRWRRGLWSELWRWALITLIWVPLAAVLLGGLLVVAIYRQARLDQTRPVDAIVVLGAAQFDCTPTAVLRARLDQALAAYDAGVAPLVVVTGGKQTGDRCTEAEAGRAYLTDHGLPASAILVENTSRTTWENLQGVARLLDERGLSRVLLVSDGFHLFRAKLMARDLGLTPYGVPASASPIAPGSSTELNYVLRETAGILAHKWKGLGIGG